MASAIFTGRQTVPTDMQPDPVQKFLRDHKYPAHLVKEGRAGLVRRWREFVGQVEKGYPLGLEDYRNDLDIRGILERAQGEDEEVRALDARLKKMLTATKHRVWDSGKHDPFWDFGYPKNAAGELWEGLHEAGLV
jgi:hypothetical protein